jgi:hypothetical protein
MPSLDDLPDDYFIIETSGARSYADYGNAEYVKRQMKGATSPYTPIIWLDIFGCDCISYAGKIDGVYESTAEARALYRPWQERVNGDSDEPWK